MPSSMALTDPSSMSELENLSDSDWLDVASSRASEDTDSVVGFDSDRELDSDYRPPSRRSYNSTASSPAGEVQAWEGLIEDGVDGSPAIQLALTSRLTALASGAEALGFEAEAPNDSEDPEEEQRVKDALDQSMMSTLSSSRSNSLNGSHTSIVHSRDLRLSFPDPLSSSHDELLNTSYENVPPVPDADVASALSPDCSESTVPPDSDIAPAAADPGASATPAVPGEDVRPDFYVVLYGSSSAVKWSLIDKLLEKAAQGSGLILTSKIVGLIDGHVRFLSSEEESRTVSVIDRTELLNAGDSSSFVPLDRPSLAVVFLPSLLLSLPEHTLYLPVLTQGFSVVDLPYSADELLDAEQHWETLRIPRSKVVPLSPFSKVVDQEEVDRAAPKQIARALRPLLVRAGRKPAHRLASRHAWTILAVLSVVLGYAIKGSVGPSGLSPIPRQQQTSSPSWGMMRPISAPVNHSVSIPTPSSISSALIPLKDFALAVLPAPLVASTSGSRQPPNPSSEGADLGIIDAPSECACGCGLITWPGRIKASTDLMLRPTPPAPALRDSSEVGLALIPSRSHSQHQDNGKGKGKALVHTDESLYTLGTWLASSLWEYFDLRTMTTVVVQELQEILDALDELVHAIGRQTALVWEQSKGGVHGLRAQIQDRHERARAKALALRQMGGRLFESVQERVRGRVNVAKENAQIVRESVWAADVWRASRVQKVRKLARERVKERRMARKTRLGIKH